MSMQIHLQTLGCRLNEAEMESWTQQFRAKGYGITARADQADLIVVNTCAVTEDAVRKSRKLVRQAHRHNPQAKLVLSGCYASLESAQAASLPGVDLVVANKDKDQLAELVIQHLDMHSMPLLAQEPAENLLFQRGRQRAFIKVQDGCRYQCTFCIVTEARGEEKSRPIKDIVAEINLLHAQGIQEIVIAGVHLGGYGRDINCNLTQLLERLLAETTIPRLRLGSIEPWDIPSSFWTLFQNPRLMPHLHLPLQSGSDFILKRMARRCKTASFSKLVQEAQTSIADLQISTDIIVGFPGETEDEWQKTLRYLENFTFSHLHIFPYSPRAGTRAATFADQIDKTSKSRRSQELHQIAQGMQRKAAQSMENRRVDVLIEQEERSASGTLAYGYTPNYLRVKLAVETATSLINKIVPANLLTLDSASGQLWGKLD